MNDHISLARRTRFAMTGIVGLTLLAPPVIAQGARAGQTQSAPKPAPRTKANPAAAGAEPAPTAPATPAPTAPATPGPKPADLKIRARYTSDAQVSENTTYYQGAGQRIEFPGMVLINQCDQKRTIQLNDKTKRFMVLALSDPAAAPAVPIAPEPAAPAPAPSGAQKPKGGVITYTTTATDTGERKSLFGSEARRIKLTTVKDATPDACDKRASKIESDGWYIDLPVHVNECESAPVPAPRPAGPGCADRIESKQSGDAKLGFAVSSTVTTTEEKDVRTASMEVADLQITSLAEGLFAVPAGYTEVKSQVELLGLSADGGAGAGSGDAATSLAEALLGSLADGSRKIAPKKPGTLRIGVVDPANTSGRDVSNSMLRAALIRNMNGAQFEAVPVQGATVADLERDAQSKACDYIVTSDLAELKSSKPGKVSGFLKKATGEPGSSSDVYDARIEFKLFPLPGEPQKPLLASSAKASSGEGFSVGSAVHLATWAGTMYMTMGMGTMMLGPLSSLSAFGASGSGLGRFGMGSIMMGPGMSSAMSIMSHAAVASGPNGMPGLNSISGLQRAGADPVMERTVSQACEKVGKAVTDELRKKKVG